MAENSTLVAARERIRSTGERLTAPRTRVLGALLEAGAARSHQEIERSLGAPRVDRVTLYRVLDWLVDHGLAHRVAGSDRVWRFSIAGEASSSHAHFECSRCGKMLCLDELSPRRMAAQMPRGYRPQRMEITVTGLCVDCP